jgi:hypothetical protein
VWRQNRAAKQLASLQLFLQLAGQWDSWDMHRKRAQLARTLLADRKALRLDDTVLVFFETLAHMVRRDLVDHDLVWTTFWVDVCSYWAAVDHYVCHARREFSDPTLFEEIEWLNKWFMQEDRRLHGASSSRIGVTESAVDHFLQWESCRGDDLVPVSLPPKIIL